MIRALPILLLLWGSNAFAIGIEQRLDDPAAETRAQALFKQIRCVVCTSESIHDSNADLAKDLRMIVREQIQQGKTDDAILAFITKRYGDYVLMKPPLKSSTYILWFGPAIVFLAGAVFMAVTLIHRSRQSSGNST